MPSNESPASTESPSHWCFYSTDGDVLGPIERRHLETIWRAGQFPEETMGFDPADQSWRPLVDWFSALPKDLKSTLPKPTPDKKLPPPPPAMTPLPPGSGRSRRGSDRKALKWQVVSIFAFLVAIMVGVVMFVRSSAVEAERNRFQERTEFLQSELAKRTESLERLSESTGEVLEPDFIKGRLLLRANDGTLVPQQGVKVLLYNRREIERHLEEALKKEESGSDDAKVAQNLVNTLPFPIATTTTDSKGAYEFRLQAAGDFVLHTNILANGSNPMLWFLGFNSTEPPYTRIDFTDSNRSTSLVPGLIVVPAR